MRTSWCTRCQKRKPITDFSPRTRHADGSYATVLSRCKECLAELARNRRKEDPEWARAVCRRDWRRIKSDPEKLAARRVLTKESKAALRQRRREQIPISEEQLRQEAQREQWRTERAERRAA